MISVTRNAILPALTLVLLAACSRGESTGRPADSGEAVEYTAGSTPASTPSAPRSSAPAVPRSYVLAAGTMIDAVLDNTITSRDARAGDTFTARVVEDVRNAGGQAVIPAGSTVLGIIVEVSPAPNNRSTGTLTLTVSSVTVRERTYDLSASLDSLATHSEERGLEAVDVARVAGGAVAGGILGRVIGGNAKGTVIGATAGGVAGGAVSMIMKDRDVVLPAGARLVLTLVQPLTVTAE
jgi:hypothetical protein